MRDEVAEAKRKRNRGVRRVVRWHLGDWIEWKKELSMGDMGKLLNWLKKTRIGRCKWINVQVGHSDGRNQIGHGV